MEKEFVPYEQALALKELGFDESCFATIDQIEYVHIKGTKSLPRGSMMYDIIDCPLYQQAFRWFREKYSLHCYISRYSLDEFDYYIEFKSIDKLTGIDWTSYYFMSTYEEAELECLKKLIEIVKQK